MDNQLIAIRDGKYDEAISLALKQLKNKPDDAASHFTLAQAYEAKGEIEQALSNVLIVVSALPDSFEALSLAAQYSSQLELHDEAYKYAKAALESVIEPNFSAPTKFIFKVVSLVPGLKSLGETENLVIETHKKQTKWLHEYVAWYENQSPNKKHQRTP